METDVRQGQTDAGLNAIDSLRTLYNNPFIFCPIFHSFYTELPKQKFNVLLAYLVLPLVLHPKTRQFFANAKSSSSLHTFLSDQERLIGLPQRVGEFKRITCISLQYAYDSGMLALARDLSLSSIRQVDSAALCPPRSIKAAKNLARILGPFDVPTTFRMLGLKEL